MYMSDFIYPIYKDLGEDENQLCEFFKRLYSNFSVEISGRLPKPTVIEVGEFLEHKYLATEINDDTFLGLDKDDYVNVNDIVKMYRIDNLEIMNKLYTKEEKDFQAEISEISAGNQHKNCCNIILESKDGVTISGYTIQGMSIKLTSLMYVVTAEIQNDDVLDLSNPWFADYLSALYLAGYLAT